MPYLVIHIPSDYIKDKTRVPDVGDLMTDVNQLCSKHGLSWFYRKKRK